MEPKQNTALLRVMQAYGYNSNSLAQVLGIHVGVIRTWINSKHVPSNMYVGTIERILRVPFEYIWPKNPHHYLEDDDYDDHEIFFEDIDNDSFEVDLQSIVDANWLKKLHMLQYKLDLSTIRDLEENLNPEVQILYRERIRCVKDILTTLPSDQQQVIQSRFGLKDDPASLDFISRIMKKSKERIRQLEVKALRTLRHTYYEDRYTEVINFHHLKRFSPIFPDNPTVQWHEHTFCGISIYVHNLRVHRTISKSFIHSNVNCTNCLNLLHDLIHASNFQLRQ